MRSLPRNSPQAAARIVALLLIADGHVSRREIDALHSADLERALGLAPNEFGTVMHQLCEDLMASAYGSGDLSATVDEHALAGLMQEVDDPALRLSILRLADVAGCADQHWSEGEARVLAAMQQHWGVLAGVQLPEPSSSLA